MHEGCDNVDLERCMGIGESQIQWATRKCFRGLKSETDRFIGLRESGHYIPVIYEEMIKEKTVLTDLYANCDWITKIFLLSKIIPLHVVVVDNGIRAMDLCSCFTHKLHGFFAYHPTV